MAQWAHYSAPDAEWTAMLAQTGGPPPMLATTDMPVRRAMVAELARKRVEAGGEESLKGIKVEERKIPVHKPHGEISIRIYTPESSNPETTYPVLVDLHGGGYVLGNLDTDELKCRSACSTHRLVVVNVDYRLAPEYPWPVGQEDSYDAVKWVAANTSVLKVDIHKGFIVNGLSAGAGFTCVITQRARKDPELTGKLTGQILQIPPTCKGGAGVYPDKYKHLLLSFEQNRDDPILSRANIKMFMDAYKQGPETDPEVSPLLAESLADLPPAYVQIAGGDPLRDEGLLYTQLLDESGVKTKLDVYPGVPHGFANYFPQLKISQKWRDDFDEGVKWLIGTTSA